MSVHTRTAKPWIGWLIVGILFIQLLLHQSVRAMPDPGVPGNIPRPNDHYWPLQYHPGYPGLLRDVYQQREGRVLWFADGQSHEARQELRWQLLELVLAGAPPQFGSWLREIVVNGHSEQDSDAIYTDAFIGIMRLRQFLTEASYQQAMTLESLSSLPLWTPPANPLIDELIAADSDQLISKLQSFQGDSEPVRRYILQLLRLDIAHTWPLLDAGPLLRPGERSDRVELIRQQLHLLAYPEVLAQGEDERRLDAGLVAALKQFQQQHGLKVDGIVGEQTRRWLNVTPLLRARLLARNQLRRQLFQQLQSNPRKMVVNLPAFELNVYRDGEVELSSRVIVGRRSRPTPLLQSAISSVVVNPAWNVPRSILRKDLLPRIRRDPDYLVRNRFTLIRYDDVPVDYADEGWQEVLYQPGIPFRLQQLPGPGNALGRYKFHFDNPFAVYLHDTSTPELFMEAERDFSSGCIRVEQAEKLANKLFFKAGYRPGRIDELLNDGKTHWFPVNRSLPIYIVYWTAWIDALERPQYRNDIYHYDTDLKEPMLPLVAHFLDNFLS